MLAQLLAGLDEGSRHVAVLDETVVLGQAAAARVSAGRGVARVGDGDHQVGTGCRGLTGQYLPHPAAGGLERGAVHLRVRAGEVDVLEDAERLALALDQHPGADAVLADRDQLAGLDVAHVLGADDVQRAGLAGHAVVLAQAPEDQRPDAGRVPEGQDALVGHHDGGEGALEPRHHGGDGVLDRVGRLLGDQRGDDLRVRGGGELDPVAAQLGVELHGVGEVAVVGQGDLAAVLTVAAGAVDRL